MPTQAVGFDSPPRNTHHVDYLGQSQWTECGHSMCPMGARPWIPCQGWGDAPKAALLETASFTNNLGKSFWSPDLENQNRPLTTLRHKQLAPDPSRMTVCTWRHRRSPSSCLARSCRCCGPSLRSEARAPREVVLSLWSSQSNVPPQPPPQSSLALFRDKQKKKEGGKPGKDTSYPCTGKLHVTCWPLSKEVSFIKGCS